MTARKRVKKKDPQKQFGPRVAKAPRGLVQIDSKLLAEFQKSSSELELAQEKLIQSEKLASLGTIAAGVAHEINNPLSFLLSNLETLSVYLKSIDSIFELYGNFQKQVVGSRPGPAITRMIEEIEKKKTEADLSYILGDYQDLMKESLEGVNRIREIVQSLKTFSRTHDDVEGETDINECILAALRVASNELKYKCELKKDLGNLPKVACNPGHMLQVFMNILINAAQAIENRGTISIRSHADHENIYVAISDTGVGISKKTAKKLFTPFFTTKPVGRGTGLGLSVSYGIIKNLGGRIEVESEVGVGSKFTVIIPHQQLPELK